jgi:hypothetical protein
MGININIYHNLRIILMLPQDMGHIHRFLKLIIKYLKFFRMSLGLNFTT